MTAVTRAVSIGDFQDLVEDTFYRSDANLLRCTTPAPEFKLSVATAGLLPVTRYSGEDVSVKRQWHHIRERPSEPYVICFPLSGTFSITQDRMHGSLVEAGHFVITCGDRPFHARAFARDAKACSQLFVLVPSHVIRSYLPNVDRFCGHPFVANEGSAKIAQQIFSGLVDESGDVSPDIAAKLGLAGLEALADSVKHTVSNELIHVDAKREQLDRVLRYINQHLSSQGLTADRVAKGCRISRRYLHYLMRYNGATFGEYLWEMRLKQAQEWVVDPEFSHFHVVDIAYMCGFRSASHFSNCYRSRFRCSPRDARLAGGILTNEDETAPVLARE